MCISLGANVRTPLSYRLQTRPMTKIDSITEHNVNNAERHGVLWQLVITVYLLGSCEVFSVVNVDKLQVAAIESAATAKAGRNATVTSMIVCAGFVICWSSSQMSYFLRFVGFNINTKNWFNHFSSVCAVSSSGIIFAQMSSQYLGLYTCKFSVYCCSIIVGYFTS